MATPLIEKILGAPAGTVVSFQPDWLLVTNGVAHQAVLEAQNVAQPAKVQLYFDHNVPTGDPEASHVFDILRDFAKKYGIAFHQALGSAYECLLHIVQPGRILVGGGSHASILGAAGALGIDVSPLELARTLESGSYQVVVPETLTVRIQGTLPEGISSMDAALQFLTENKDISGKMLQIIAPQWNLHQKSVFCSMVCGAGAFSAICTDAGTPDRVLKLDGCGAMAVGPCGRRENQKTAPIFPVSQLRGRSVEAGQIGGYTGGTIEDLRRADHLIQGKQLAKGFRLSVCPATSADYIKAMEEGIIEHFIDYGAQIQAAGDRSEVRQGAGVIGRGETLVTTGLYTYAGCMGVPDSSVYTASVETVIRASWTKSL